MSERLVLNCQRERADFRFLVPNALDLLLTKTVTTIAHLPEMHFNILKLPLQVLWLFPWKLGYFCIFDTRSTLSQDITS